MNIRINHIEAISYVDGPGPRTVLFVQGCTMHCPGCHSRHTWALDGGKVEKVSDVAQTLATLAQPHGNVTLSGGEIFLQSRAIAELVIRLHALGIKSIVAYTGLTWEQINDPFQTNYAAKHSIYDMILEHLDILVDGPFVKQMDDDYITWRGSRNQSVIDVQAVRKGGKVVEVDWDNEITLLPNGELIAPAGQAEMFNELGSSSHTRMCGQSR